MKFKPLISAALSTALLCTPLSQAGTTPVSAAAMRDMTTMQIVNDMGMGINLGNTFEACGEWIDQWGDGTPAAYETAWGSPVITQPMIQGIADAGFGVLRVPVAWSNMMVNDGNYNINPQYLARVKQIIDWALDADLYVIMNLHWDSGWLENLPTDYDNCMRKYTAIWTQLCDAFRDYSDYLMFESQNEELGWNSVWNQWGGTNGKTESYGYVNAVNQKFVDIVRASGGNNAKRHLLISGYNTDVTLTCDPLFKMPNDPAGRCALSVHYYTPAGFCILTQDESWGKATSTWGSDADYQELNRYMDMLKSTYTSKGIPVIIGEYGCPKENKEVDSIRRFLTAVCEAALSRGGICPVLWDVPDQHYDRNSCKMADSQLHNMMLEVKSRYVVETPKPVKGDINKDGSFSVADIVMMQKYLVKDGSITDWEAADLNKDSIIDGNDFTALKRMLLN